MRRSDGRPQSQCPRGVRHFAVRSGPDHPTGAAPAAKPPRRAAAGAAHSAHATVVGTRGTGRPRGPRRRRGATADRARAGRRRRARRPRRDRRHHRGRPAGPRRRRHRQRGGPRADRRRPRRRGARRPARADQQLRGPARGPDRRLRDQRPRCGDHGPGGRRLVAAAPGGRPLPVRCGTACGLQARYAAADLAAPERRGRALSLVVWATTVGSVLGPNLAAPGADLGTALGLPPLAGAFLVSAVVFAVVALVLLPAPARPAAAGPAPGRGDRAPAAGADGHPAGAARGVGDAGRPARPDVGGRRPRGDGRGHGDDAGAHGPRRRGRGRRPARGGVGHQRARGRDVPVLPLVGASRTASGRPPSWRWAAACCWSPRPCPGPPGRRIPCSSGPGSCSSGWGGPAA